MSKLTPCLSAVAGLFLALVVFAPAGVHAQQGASQQFRDAHRIPGWVEPAVNHLVEEGVLEGFPDGTFRAGKTVTRAELAQALHYALQNVDQKLQSSGDGGSNVSQSSREMVDALRSEFSRELEIVREIAEENQSRLDDLEPRVEENTERSEENQSRIEEALSGIEWSGDFRFRSEVSVEDPPGGDRQRERIRFRLNSGIPVTDRMDVNFRLTTGRNPGSTSGNQTLDGFNSGYDFSLDYANATYSTPISDNGGEFTVVAGSDTYNFMENNEIIFDSDVTYPGLVEQFSFPAGDSTVNLNLMQNAVDERGGEFSDDTWIHAAQLGAEDLGAEGLDGYIGYFTLQGDDQLQGSIPFNEVLFNQDFSGDGNVDNNDFVPANVPGLDGYSLINLGASYETDVNEEPLLFYADYLENTDYDAPSGSGLTQVQSALEDEDGRAWSVGVNYGATDHVGGVEWEAEYREQGAFSNFPFFADSDFKSNTQGFQLGIDYQLRENLEVTWTGIFTEARNLWFQNSGIENQLHQFDFRYSF